MSHIELGTIAHGNAFHVLFVGITACLRQGVLNCDRVPGKRTRALRFDHAVFKAVACYERVGIADLMFDFAYTPTESDGQKVVNNVPGDALRGFAITGLRPQPFISSSLKRGPVLNV
jgi:hypothetical protein